MEILIRGNKIEITDAMKEYANEKLKKLEKYINEDKVKATVLVKVRNYYHKVEVTIPMKNLILRAEEEQQDFYACIDMVINKLERQLKKNKNKIKSREKRGYKEFNIDDLVEETEDDEIKKVKKVDVKPMTEEEAVLQMELLGHNFYLFKDGETGESKVVYKRNDGGYGVIESK